MTPEQRDVVFGLVPYGGKPRVMVGHHDSAVDLEVEQKVAGRRLDVAGQSESPR